MKKYIFVLAFFCLVSTTFGQKGSIRAYLSHSSFYTPEYGPFVETYLSILGKSVQFVKTENGKFQGTVMVTMLFKQNDSIRDFRKYDLHTVEIDDTAHINFILFDQQRVALPSGGYTLELQLSDKNLTLPPFSAKDTIVLKFDSKKLAISDIELVESFSEATSTSKMAKSGFDFIPYQDYYYPQNINKATFYAEIYNTQSAIGIDAPFVVATSIQSIETGKPFDGFFRIKRETAGPVNVVFSEFDITTLPTGNYTIVISVRDKENKELATQSMFIQRSNPGVKYNANKLQNVVIANSFVSRLTQPDSLREYIRMCWPVAGANEKLFINYNMIKGDLLTLQQFFLEFWTQRNQADPESEWLKYYSQVLSVEQEFSSTNKRGYETDRGRVYLQYGPPNQRIIEPYTATTLPYEIWQYYQFGRQTDLKFVFYTRDRSINDFELAHSNAIGEIKNVNWQYEIRGLSSPQDTDKNLYKSAYEIDQFGEHSGEFFNNPH